MTSSPDALALWLGPDLEHHECALAPPPPSPASATDAPSWLPELSPRLAPLDASAEEEAYARGFSAGMALGRVEGEEGVRTALTALSGVGSQMRAQERDFARRRERSIEALSMAVARKLIEREVRSDPELLHGLIRKALDLLPPEERLEIRLHPDDLAALREAVEADVLAGRMPSSQWVSDPTIERGGFLVESPHRIIDGRPDVVLRALFERLDHE